MPWLFKTEPESFALDDLEHAPRKTTCWDGVRSFEARNLLRDKIAVGDHGFLYHSNAAPSVIVAIVEVVRAGYPDPTAWEKGHDHFDPKSDPKAPTWFMVDLRLVRRLERPVALDEAKSDPVLKEMALVKKSRLSVQPVTESEWQRVLALARLPAPKAVKSPKSSSSSK